VEAVVASNSRETVARATDKALLAELAADAGVAAPATVEPDDVTFPAVVKPAMTAFVNRGGTQIAPAARVVHDAEELRAAVADHDEYLIQPYIDGGLIAVAGVAWQGEVVCSCHQVARRIYPKPLGVSAFAETVAIDRELDARLATIVARLGWSGIFEFQLLRTRNGTSPGPIPFRSAHVIDLNPRPYGSLALAIAAGLNLPSIWADLLLGREPRIGVYRPGVWYRAEIRELRALAAALSRGRLAAALTILRPRRRTVHSVFSLRDPAPILAVVQRASGRLLKA
jgi:predicted ATP-grasp superfamily ATP-dependent carboligase